MFFFPLPSSSSSFPLLLPFLFASLLIRTDQQQQHQPTTATTGPIRNVRAHYDAGTDTILVDWEWREVDGKELEDYELFVRYKVSSQQGANEWHRSAADEDSLGAKIPVGRILNNGDEMTVQVSGMEGTKCQWAPKFEFKTKCQKGKVLAEPRDPEDGAESERSEPLVIWIARRSDGRGNEDEEETGEGQQQRDEAEPRTGASLLAEDELIPPYNFTASVLGPGQVRLEWRQPPLPGSVPSPFYIVNIRQLSSNTGDRFPPQQLRVDGTQFVLGSLNAGENYEFTIRTALGPEHVSSAAAIVELALPSEDDLVEVGNLIVTSRFRPDGHGMVNLTWEVPAHLLGKIRSYEMRYVDSDRAGTVEPMFWEQLVFPGDAPTTELYNLRSDTEYVLRIRTTMTSGTIVESGEFRFRTPKSGGVNPIARLDVLYSSETPTVRLQWILGPHINTALVSGYDVFISDRYDLPEMEWQRRRVQGREPQVALDSLSPATTYFVRIDVRNLDGTVVKSQSAYRFTTLETLPVPSRRDFRRTDSLAFQQIGPGQVNIQWELAEAVRLSSRGITIFYNTDSREPLDRWHRLDLENPETRSVVLVGLRENSLYDVQIVPVAMDGRPMWAHAQRIKLRTTETEGEGRRIRIRRARRIRDTA